MAKWFSLTTWSLTAVSMGLSHVDLMWESDSLSQMARWHMGHLVTKPTNWHVRPAKTQISLGIRPVWSESLLCAQWVAKDPNCLPADSEDWSDCSGWSESALGAHAILLGFVTRGLIYWRSAVALLLTWLAGLTRSEIILTGRKTQIKEKFILLPHPTHPPLKKK